MDTMDIGRGPNFLCIGGSRCGTTWLYRNLLRHPDLWLPPVKELRFFDMLVDKKHKGLPLVFHSEYSRRRAKIYLQRQARRIRNGKMPNHVIWHVRFFLMAPSVNWYTSLFPTANKFSGECCPSYSRLTIDVVERVNQILPNAKIIYMCRNPVHRDWSLAALLIMLGRGISIDDADDELIERTLNRIVKRGSTNHLSNLGRWATFYQADKIFVGFHDELGEAPEELLLRVFEFLGVDALRRHIGGKAHRKIGAQPYHGIPERYARMLSERYYDQVVRMHERFANVHTQGWLDYVTQRTAP